VFIRLTGCNLRCGYCDTEYAFYEGKLISVDEILKKVESAGIPLVEITGGEPLLQKEVYPLMDALLAQGYEVLLETGGSISIKDVPDSVIRIMDFKCPGSGEEENNLWDNIQYLTAKDEVKFVILDRVDYEWSRNILRRYHLDRKAHVLFSPVYDKLDLVDLTEWILEDGLPVRLQTQLHKVIWDKGTIGV
ncbi:MAG: radical SAM protein, partial [Nitrospinales bacterium]